MAISLSSATVSEVVLGALIAVLILRRTVGMVHGTPVRPTRLLAFGGFYLVLMALVVSSSALLYPWPWGPAALAADAAAVGLAAWVALRHVERRVVIERRPDGAWIYRLSPLLPVVYVALFVTRLVVDLVVLGASPFAGPTAIAGGTPASEEMLVAMVDLLFAMSTGLLIGRGLGVYRAYRKRTGSEPSTGVAA